MSSYLEGQIHQLANALEKAEFTREDITKLGQSQEILGGLRRVLLGHAEIVTPKHIIDCDADPFVPHDWYVEEHRKGGQFTWNPANIALYLDKRQKDYRCTEGNKLHEALAEKQVLNANVLDYLLAHPHLIPEEWKSKAVFFWGTIYRDRGGVMHVRCLVLGPDGWDWYSNSLGHDWHCGNPAAVPAS